MIIRCHIPTYFTTLKKCEKNKKREKVIIKSAKMLFLLVLLLLQKREREREGLLYNSEIKNSMIIGIKGY